MDDETRDQVQERFATIAMLMEDVSARLLSTAGNVQEVKGSLDLLKGMLVHIDPHAKEIMQALA